MRVCGWVVGGHQRSELPPYGRLLKMDHVPCRTQSTAWLSYERVHLMYVRVRVGTYVTLPQLYKNRSEPSRILRVPVDLVRNRRVSPPVDESGVMARERLNWFLACEVPFLVAPTTVPAVASRTQLRLSTIRLNLLLRRCRFFLFLSFFCDAFCRARDRRTSGKAAPCCRSAAGRPNQVRFSCGTILDVDRGVSANDDRDGSRVSGVTAAVCF